MRCLNLLMSVAILCVGLMSLQPPMVGAIPLSQFYPYGTTAGDSVLPRSDDGASGAIPVIPGFKYFGTIYTNLYINNNGPISFDGTMTSFTPQPFPVTGSPPFLAAYWGDVDTTPSDGGAVYYRATSNTALLNRASAHITAQFTQAGRTFQATRLFIATWERVGYYEEHTDLTNTFQAVLITDGECSFVTYLYADGLVQWTTGDASGGQGGLGGTPAQAGFDAGDETRFFSIPGSQTPAIVNIEGTTNVDIHGQWTFRVDLAEIVQPHERLFMYMCGSDPHFAIQLSEGELLCYTFQGRHNTIFNLLGNDHLQMNALFVPDATDYDNTWLGSIGVAALGYGKNTTLKFTASDRMIRIGGRVELEAKTIKKLSFNKGELSVLNVSSDRPQKYPRVLVDFIDAKLSFTVGFTKDSHLDLYWHSTGIPSKISTGVVGQFFRDGVKIDVDAQLLRVPGHPPVPVEKRDLWKFMSKSLVGDRQCWTSAYPSSQGAGIVAGTYEDYVVDDLLAAGQCNATPE